MITGAAGRLIRLTGSYSPERMLTHQVVGGDDAAAPQLQELLLASDDEAVRAACLPDEELHPAVRVGIALPNCNPRTTRRGANPLTRLATPNVCKTTLDIRTAARQS